MAASVLGFEGERLGRNRGARARKSADAPARTCGPGIHRGRGRHTSLAGVPHVSHHLVPTPGRLRGSLFGRAFGLRRPAGLGPTLDSLRRAPYIILGAPGETCGAVCPSPDGLESVAQRICHGACHACARKGAETRMSMRESSTKLSQVPARRGTGVFNRGGRRAWLPERGNERFSPQYGALDVVQGICVPPAPPVSRVDILFMGFRGSPWVCPALEPRAGEM